MAETAATIIDEKGGPSVVARAIRKRGGAVRAWKHRNSIPRGAWPDLIEAFPDLTLERLKATELQTAEASA
ncbi:MAG: hypothetical protein P4L73_20675 [Caulobacteraceae bacterium]|nr:hypothetical protein [Caulobacteraceae bacterium]